MVSGFRIPRTPGGGSPYPAGVTSRHPRRALLPGLLGGVLLLGAALAGSTLSSAPPAAPTASAPRLASGGYTCTGYCRHPTNAAKVFKWGSPAWGDEWETAKVNRKHWRSNRPKRIGSKGGMLTIRAAGKLQSITTWGTQAARYGRWEARVRIHERPNSDGAQYQATWMLQPLAGNSCHANEVTLATYTAGDERVGGWVRTLDDHEFGFSRATNLNNLAWHTYAVEITPKRISWFSDTLVLRTEKRAEALAGARYRPQFVMTGVPGQRMRETWLQMDWVRYYSLKRPNARSVKANAMAMTTYAGGC